MKGFESHPYIPNSVPEVQEEMLREIGLGSLEELHKNVPELLKLKNEMNLPKAFRSEYELKRHVERVLSKDTAVSFERTRSTCLFNSYSERNAFGRFISFFNFNSSGTFL